MAQQRPAESALSESTPERLLLVGGSSEE